MGQTGGIRSYAQLLGQYLRPQRGKVALLALGLLVASGILVYTPQLIKQFIGGASLGALTRIALIYLGQFLVQVTGAALLMAGILAVLWLEDWRVGLVRTLFTLTVSLVFYIRRKVAVQATRAEREASA